MSDMLSSDPPTPPPHRPFRRRHFLIDRRGQLIATAKVAGLVLVFLILLNTVFALLSAMETREILASNPQLTEEVYLNYRRTTLIVATGSFVILLLVVVRSIMLTHRTAGAAFNLERCLKRVTSGDYDITLSLREKDNLRHLQEPFNQMVESLKIRAAKDRETVTELASKVEALGHPELAEEIRQLGMSKDRIDG